MFWWSLLICTAIFYFLARIFQTGQLLQKKDNKCVLITGCDSGVGLTLALIAHSFGFHVIAACLNCEGQGAKLLQEKCPERMLIIQMDVTNQEQIKSAFHKITAYLSTTSTVLWALVNNAGILVYGQADWQTESQVSSQMDVNFMGVWRTTKAFLPLLRFSRGIKNISFTFSFIKINSLFRKGHQCL